MNAFRFLSLLTVGFSLLVLVFLLNAAQGRMEGEATRWIEGPEVPLEPGSEVEWTLNLGSVRIEEGWPAAQRQPRLFLVEAGAEGPDRRPSGTFADVEVTVNGVYLEEDGASHPAFVAGPAVSGEAAEGAGELAFGPLWMSWEHDLSLRVTVNSATGGVGRLVLRGKPTHTYLEARSIARTLWVVFTAIAALGFVGLMVTVGSTVPGTNPPHIPRTERSSVRSGG